MISNLAAMSDDPRLTPALKGRAEHLLGTMKRIQKAKLAGGLSGVRAQPSPDKERSRHDEGRGDPGVAADCITRAFGPRHSLLGRDGNGVMPAVHAMAEAQPARAGMTAADTSAA